MINKVVLLTLLLFACTVKGQKTEPLKLAVYLPQSPPYMFIDLNTGEVTGILPEIMKKYATEHNLAFSYQYLNRVRAEKSLYEGKSDVSLLAPAWVEHPEKLIYSDPLYLNGDKFYATKPIPDEIEFNGQIVCTRKFFKYPVFDQLVKKNKVTRMDTESETNQFKMLLSGRCDYIYINEWVADYMIKHDFSFAKFYQAKTLFDSSNGILAFHPSWQHRLPEFNQFIRQIKQSGELNEIITRYTE